MKSSTCLLAVLCLGLVVSCANKPAPAPGAAWTDNFAAAKAAAAKSGRPILANFTGSDWCPFCQALESEIFTQAVFVAYAKSNLVLFVADYPQKKVLPPAVVKQNEGLETQYGIDGFPTVLLLDAEGNVLVRGGYIPGGAEQYVTLLQDALAKSSWKPPTPVRQSPKSARGKK